MILILGNQREVGAAMEKLKHKKILGIVVIIILLIIGIGGKVYMDRQAFNNEMVAVVKSDEAKKVFENGLKNLDPKALTSDGIIKSYEIDYDSIKHSPMGSIIVNLIINHDKRLLAKYDLNKRNGVLKYGGVDISSNLSELTEGIQNEYNK